MKKRRKREIKWKISKITQIPNRKSHTNSFRNTIKTTNCVPQIYHLETPRSRTKFTIRWITRLATVLLTRQLIGKVLKVVKTILMSFYRNTWPSTKIIPNLVVSRNWITNYVYNGLKISRSVSLTAKISRTKNWLKQYVSLFKLSKEKMEKKVINFQKYRKNL